MIKQRTGAACIEPFIKARDQVAQRDFFVCGRHEVGGNLQNPVNIDRRTHIGLNLRDDTRDWQGNNVTRAFCIQVNVGNRLCAHMNAGRSDSRAARIRGAAINASAKRRHHHVDIAKAHRRTGQKSCGSCCFGG
ncbi:hypothetical protein D3C80_586560 [compost metagenome]